MGISNREALLRHPVAGPSWEGFAIEQLLGHLAAKGQRADAYYLRTSDGHEIDLLLQFGTTLAALEIKLSSRASRDDIAKLDRCADLAGAEHRYVVARPPRRCSAVTAACWIWLEPRRNWRRSAQHSRRRSERVVAESAARWQSPQLPRWRAICCSATVLLARLTRFGNPWG